MAKPKIYFECNKCKGEPEINKESSNEKWTTYKSSDPCKCGGKFKIKVK